MQDSGELGEVPIPAKLRALRWANGITIEELAEAAGGMDPSYVSKIELGRAKVPETTQDRMAHALGVTLAALRLVTTDEVLRWLDAGPPAPRKAALSRATQSHQPIGRSSPWHGTLRPPLPPQGLVGRYAELERLRHWLTDSDDRRIAVAGMGGIGKTSLAIAAVSDPDIVHHFPDGILWANLYDTPDAAHIIDVWSDAMRLDGGRTSDAQAVQLQEALRSRRLLIVIDGADRAVDSEAAQLVALAGPDTKVLITTRERPVAYDFATRTNTMVLSALAPDESFELIRRLAPEIVEANPEAAREVCTQLGHHPLAISLAGHLLANSTDVPARAVELLQTMIRDRTFQLKLGGVAHRTATVASIIAGSFLSLEVTDQRRLSELARSELSHREWAAAEAAKIWHVSLGEAETVVLQSIQKGLVEAAGDNFRLHPLVAAYASQAIIHD